MKAMILAAGLGSRLRPLTDHRPKALVEVAGRTLLQITLARLRTFGIVDVILNTHHFAGMIQDYLQKNNNFGMCIEISREEVLLDTGGGLKNAAHFFRDEQGPFILHNVDVISMIDLGRLVQVHKESHALATLAVQERKTSRYLLFDEANQLCGRRSASDEQNPSSRLRRALAFSGIHVISPRIFSLMSEDSAFSIIDCYLRLAAQGEKILGFRVDEYYWRDVGRPEHVAQAADDLNQNVLLP